MYVVYASSLADGYDESELVSILATARRRNAAVSVTGVLLYSNRSFFQILEGPRDAVLTLYERISLDPRHCGITRLLEGPIEQRRFRDWTMGLARVNNADLREVDGLSDFFATGHLLHELDVEGARLLAEALSSGWLRMRCESAMVDALLSPITDRRI